MANSPRSAQRLAALALLQPGQRVWLVPTMLSGALVGAAASLPTVGIESRAWWLAACLMCALAGHLGAHASSGGHS